MKYFFLSSTRQMSILQMTGIALLFLGILTLIGIGIDTLHGGVPDPQFVTIPRPTSPAATAISAVKPNNQATIMALSMLLVTLSWPLIFPSMLRSSSKGEISSTRTCVYMITATFVLFAVRSGWTDPAMQKVVLNGGWISVLGIAFGAKTLQYFAENNPFAKNNPVGAIASPTTTGTTNLISSPTAAPQTLNPGLSGIASLPSAKVASKQDLPIHFHSEISLKPPTDPPPAIKKALNP